MKNFTAFFLILSAVCCQAQEIKPVKTYFFKSRDAALMASDIKLNSLDSADYIRTISIGKNNENLFDVTEYYPNKTLKKIGSSLNDNMIPRYSGNVISYYPSGKKESEETFIMGDLLGNATYYYQNSTLKKRVFYTRDEKKIKIEKVDEFNDSLGNHFLNEEKSGFFKVIEKTGEVIEGAYLNGLKDKAWKTFNPKKNETYFDEYKTGEFVSGKTIDANGKTVKYDEIEKLPEFDGGLKAFGSFLGKNLRYPPKARDNNIQGRVYLSFIVDKDGNLIDLKVVKGVDEELDNEALRVMRMSPKWNPGTQRGISVRVSYTVPIFFQLQTSSPSRTKHFGSYR